MSNGLREMGKGRHCVNGSSIRSGVWVIVRRAMTFLIIRIVTSGNPAEVEGRDLFVVGFGEAFAQTVVEETFAQIGEFQRFRQAGRDCPAKDLPLSRYPSSGFFLALKLKTMIASRLVANDGPASINQGTAKSPMEESGSCRPSVMNP